MVAHRPDRLRELSVVRRDRTALAGGDDLAWVNERQPSRPRPPHARPPRRAPSAPAASSISTTPWYRRLDLAPARRAAEEVHDQHGAGALREGVGHGFRPQVHRLGVDIDEHRLRAGERDDVGGRGERVRRHDHLVARPDQGEHCQMERSRPRVTATACSTSQARARARPRTRPPWAPLSAVRSRAPRRPRRAPPRRGPAMRAGSRRCRRSRYHAIVRLSPSSRSTLASSRAPRLVDVRDPHLDVRVVQGPELDLGL